MNDPLYNHPVWQNQTRRGEVEEKDEGLKEANREGKEVEGEESNCQRTPKLEMEKIVNRIIQSKFVASSSRGLEVASSDSAKNSTPEGTDGGMRKTSVIQDKDICASASSNDGEEVKTLHSSSPSAHEISDKPACNPDPDCTECRIIRDDPLPTDLVMYLHASSYKVYNFVHLFMFSLATMCFILQGNGWSFSTPTPAWAASDWIATEK